MIFELNNPWYAPAIKILIIPRKRPAGLRGEIVRVLRDRRAHAHVCSLQPLPLSIPLFPTHIHSDRGHTLAQGIFVHGGYERGFRGKDKQPWSVFALPRQFSRYRRDYGKWRKTPIPPRCRAFSPWKFNEPSEDSRFYRATLALFLLDTSLLFATAARCRHAVQACKCMRARVYVWGVRTGQKV